MANKIIQKNEEIDWENLKEEDLNKEDVHFKISRDAFDNKIPYCSICSTKMERKIIKVPLTNTPFTAMIDAFVCSKCGVDLLNGMQARKLDELMNLTLAIKSKNMGIKRSLNYDGKSIFIRLPIELKKYKDRPARIIPLEEKKFLIEIE